MKIHLFEYDPAWENKYKNMEKIQSLLNDKKVDGDLLIFPEMTLTGFSMNPEKLAEDKEEKSFQFFSDISKKFSINIFAGIIEVEGENYFNTLLNINRQGVLVNYYRKVHPFSFSEENKHYFAGKKPVIAEIENWKIGLSICYDLRFPELFRFYAKERVHLIVNIANWPVPRIEHWKTLLKARAIENQCYVAAVNRVGKDPKADYNGFSSVYDPMGNEIALIQNEEKIISVKIEKEKVEEIRNKFPFLNDIRLI